jgi:ABC-type bacteriocin/lantibiotic exporter with double-glycine peptidase domain
MNQFEHYVENLTGVWNSFQQVAFERAGLKAVFDHVRENDSRLVEIRGQVCQVLSHASEWQHGAEPEKLGTGQLSR